jgi:DNA-binding MarR family transcriptional regulator
MTLTDDPVLRVQVAYPQIYFACHVRHPRARTSAHRISDRDASLLGHLSPSCPMSPADLARHLGVRASTLSAQLKRLQKLGYLECRARSDDRRRVDVLLAPAGLAAIQGTSVLDTELVRAVLERLAPRDLERAVEGLELLAQASRAFQFEGDGSGRGKRQFASAQRRVTR